MSTYHVRSANESDIGSIQQIYQHYVLHSTATAEFVVPSEAVMLERYQAVIAAGFPYVVAEDEHYHIIGYAYASAFSEREAFRFSTSYSVYLAPHASGNGVASALLQAIEDALRQKETRHLVALVSGDNEASLRFHQRHQFQQIGCFPEAMHKFDRWIDLLWLHKEL
ncbi:N-acetyltransferase [Tuanshanicoccus lijuaniae]|uniref:N-acetyltransferase family protein n=1 Tax=Aerococcaceae bacterium zg-1292 TaxID=2774330 RepID=UPI001936A628|nr:N-acetyltransferase [Aerococcaceae bacterium zg-1292]MBF6625332.1 N-acetyltransferase [Aerococcaceae bacterium zg-BR9]MBF6978460.1 N-acetyltransferase [Aerococcaceae bacterium zg-BR22]QQA37243.1 N-acetyltransferase [Aerococcaceae bacterium zg-1292]